MCALFCRLRLKCDWLIDGENILLLPEIIFDPVIYGRFLKNYAKSLEVVWWRISCGGQSCVQFKICLISAIVGDFLQLKFHTRLARLYNITVESSATTSVKSDTFRCFSGGHNHPHHQQLSRHELPQTKRDIWMYIEYIQYMICDFLVAQITSFLNYWTHWMKLGIRVAAEMWVKQT